MTTRRDFMKTASLTASAVMLGANKLWAIPRMSSFFALNDFIADHPDAVFILSTSVDAKSNAGAIRSVGEQLGQTLFVAKEQSDGAFPLGTNVVLKPNMTAWAWDKAPLEEIMGIQTDANFVEGLITALGGVGVTNKKVFIREANYTSTGADGKWFRDLALRTGIDLRDFDVISKLSAADIQWADVPGGVWYTKIPYLAPVNSPGSCLINIAKFKSHSMGMTLCSKNLQGTNARPYVAHCTGWGSTMSGVDLKNVATNANDSIKANYERHKSAGIPRWDLPGTASGGLWMETHHSRMLDNNSVLQPLLNIIEGIYGREGPFVSGPDDNNGYGRDMMTNVVIFGKNARHVDLIGTYLGGHEPGNFGMFHIARERGLSKYLNPRDVPVYEWTLDGSATLTPLDNFPRAKIRTLYLQKAGEEKYHMVDEPYDYSGSTAVSAPKPTSPDVFSISQNFPNPFNPSTSIQYYIPRAGNVRLEVFDVRGQIVDILVDGSIPAGDHLAVWRSERCASGTYFYRMVYNGVGRTKSMVLLR